MYNKIDKLLKNIGGVKYWDFRDQTISANRVTGWNNEIKDMLCSEKSGINFRIFVGNGVGFAYSYDGDIKKVVNKAVKIAKLMDKNTKEIRDIYIGKTIKDNKKSKFKINPKNISFEEKKKLVLEYSKPTEKNIVSRQATYSEYYKKNYFTNSVGSDIKQNLVFTYIRVHSTAKDKFIENYADATGGMDGYETTKRFPKVAKKSNDNALAMLKAKNPKGGKSNIIIDGPLAEVFIHEALGHASEADHIMENLSCLKDLQGKKIANDFVNVYDDSRGKNSSWGGQFYDDEGTKTSNTTLIKNGILNSYLHSRESAAYLGVKPTGNGRAQDISHRLQVRMSNTYIGKGDYSFEGLLKKLKNGFYLVGSKGGQVSPAKGTFQFACMQGFVVKNGELKQRLRNVALTGNILELLKNIKAIGNKLDDSRPGQCGKNGQWAFVDGRCPRILIKDAIVGGS